MNQNNQVEKRVHTDKFGHQRIFTATFHPEKSVTSVWNKERGEETIVYPAYTSYHIFTITKGGAVVPHSWSYTQKTRAEKRWASIIAK